MPVRVFDPDGVALAGVKALDERTLALQQRVGDPQKQLDDAKQQNEELKKGIERIERQLAAHSLQ